MTATSETAETIRYDVARRKRAKVCHEIATETEPNERLQFANVTATLRLNHRQPNANIQAKPNEGVANNIPYDFACVHASDLLNGSASSDGENRTNVSPRADCEAPHKQRQEAVERKSQKKDKQ